MKRRALEASGATRVSRALACACATLLFACGTTSNGTSEAGGVAVGGMDGAAGSRSGAGDSPIVAGSSSGGTEMSTGGLETSTGGSATSAGGSNAGAGGLVAGAGAGTAGGSPMASTAVITNRNDNLRSGANLAETSLTPATVSASGFGLLFSRSVDAQIYAQPLYLGGLTLPNGQQHNVVFVATAQNSVYAFDADNAATSTPLWHKNMGASGQTSGFGCTDMTPEVGITSTPVIDQQAGNMYLVAKGEENGTWVQRIHILDILTGSDRPGSPVVISASVPGTGDGSTGGKVSFNAKTNLN